MDMDPHSEWTADAVAAADDAPVWDRAVVLMPTFAVLAMVGGLFKSFSVAANLYVLVLGGIMMWLGLAEKSARRASPSRLARGGLWWLVPAAVFLVVEVINFALGSTYDHPTLSILLSDPLEHYSVRSVSYFAWLSAFWGLVRR
jgi:hypothetical protein